jgi:ATP-binding cassette, subfamily C, bacterial exporter for protease/lipase
MTVTLRFSDKHQELRKAFAVVWPALSKVLSFSLFTNILVLAPSWYMMEVYDRVVNSRSHREQPQGCH